MSSFCPVWAAIAFAIAMASSKPNSATARLLPASARTWNQSSFGSANDGSFAGIEPTTTTPR